MKTFRLLSLTALVAIAAAASAGTVYSNAPGGDKIVGPASGVVTPLAGAPGWTYYSQGAGTAGIDTTYARNGNGSFHMTGTSGASEADLRYRNYNTPGDSTSGLKAMGTLASLTSLSYDWYRNSSSTNPGVQHPSFRVYFDADGDFGTDNDRGLLFFERAYNGGPKPVQTNSWQSDDILNFNGTGGKVWLLDFNKGPEEIYNRTFNNWATTPNPNAAFPSLNKGAVIYGLGFGSGEGWAGKFDGAVDNVTIGFNGVNTNFNFEAQPVPEPASVAALGLGALGLVRRRRAKRASR